MKIIGLDLGSKTCGIAISDEMQIISRVYDTFRFTPDDYETCAKHIMEVCAKERVETIVLGYPKHMNGDQGIRAKISDDFKALIETNSKIKVVLWDERLSTVSANRAMLSGNVKRKERKEKKDELAAVVILQGYLDYKTF